MDYMKRFEAIQAEVNKRDVQSQRLQLEREYKEKELVEHLEKIKEHGIEFSNTAELVQIYNDKKQKVEDALTRSEQLLSLN